MKYKIKYRSYTISQGQVVVDQPNLAWDALKDDYRPFQEEMYVIIMDVKNKVMEKHLVYRCVQNMIILVPRDILRLVIASGGCNFILAHSHPSGDVSPTNEDILATKKMKDAASIIGVNLLDHIIFTDQKFCSMKKQGII